MTLMFFHTTTQYGRHVGNTDNTYQDLLEHATPTVVRVCNSVDKHQLATDIPKANSSSADLKTGPGPSGQAYFMPKDLTRGGNLRF